MLFVALLSLLCCIFEIVAMFVSRCLAGAKGGKGKAVAAKSPAAAKVHTFFLDDPLASGPFSQPWHEALYRV